MELFHLAEHPFSRSANTIHNGPNTRSKLLAVLAGMCAQKANGAESTLAMTLAGKIEDQSLRKLHWLRSSVTRERVSGTLAFTHKPPPNAYPLAFISKTFHCRFTVILSFPGARGWYRPWLILVHKRKSSSSRAYIPVIKIGNNLARSRNRPETSKWRKNGENVNEVKIKC